MIDSYSIMRPLLAPPIRWAWQGRVVGLEYLPVEGSVLLAANHRSYVDFLLLSAVLPRRITFLAKQRLFSEIGWNWLMRATGQVRVGGGEAAREACLRLRGLVAEGRLIGIFPEGTRSRDGRTGRFHNTVIKLSRRHSIPVLPVYLHGTRRAWAPDRKLPRRFPCHVVFGPPYRPGNDLQAETSALRLRIEDLAHAI